PYDGRDLEAMLVDLGVLAEVLDSFGSAQKIDALGGVEALVEMCRTAAFPVARLRLASRREGWSVRFDAVDLTRKIDRSTLRLDIRGYCMALVSSSEVDFGSNVLIDIAEGTDAVPPR